MQIGKLVQEGAITIKTGPFGTQLKASEYQESGTPVLNVKNLGYGSVSSAKLDHVGSNTVERLRIHLLKQGDIVFGRKGAVDRHAYIDDESDGWMQGSDCIRLRVETDDINPRFLSYYFLTNKHKAFMVSMCSHGTTMASLNQNILEQIDFPFMEREYQDKITGSLEIIDEKIKVNQKINENLLQQAQSLYEHLCDNCTSSELVSLAELMDYAGGSQPPASEFIFEEKAGYIRFVQIRDYDTDSHITYIPESARNKLCEEHDIMIARYGASLGRICSGINGAYNVALAKVFPKKPYYREFLRCYLSSRVFYEGINNKGGRSAQAGFNQSDIKSFELRLPSENDLISFEEIASSMFEHRLTLNKENRKLASLRDALLPKLMSGELDVSELDI